MLKKTKERHSMRPTRQIALSFFMVILIGSILLTLPISNNGEATSYLNNLFIATSATCVTGLVPVVPAEQYNLFGQLVIIMLIQIGGLGFLTFLNLLLVMIRKKISLTNKLVMQEALNQSSLNEIPKFLKNVIKYTFLVEGIGAVLLALVFIPDYGVVKGIYFSIFHFISAFCNSKLTGLSSDKPSFVSNKEGVSDEPSAAGAITTLTSSHMPACKKDQFKTPPPPSISVSMPNKFFSLSKAIS